MSSYINTCKHSKPSGPPLVATRLLDQVRERLRYMHCSLQTEESYGYWIKFFVRWHGRSGAMRHPRELGQSEVEAFLTMLAAERRVSTSTNRQALSLLHLYKTDTDHARVPVRTRLRARQQGPERRTRAACRTRARAPGGRGAATSRGSESGAVRWLIGRVRIPDTTTVHAPGTLLFLLFLLFSTPIVALARSINRRNSRNSKNSKGARWLRLIRRGSRGCLGGQLHRRSYLPDKQTLRTGRNR